MSSSSPQAVIGQIQTLAPEQSERVAITFVCDGATSHEPLTYAELHELARKASSLLAERAAAAAQGLLPELASSATISVERAVERTSGTLYLHQPSSDGVALGGHEPPRHAHAPGPRPTLSIVVPAYRSQDCLDELAARVRRVGEALLEPYELILVNDGSPDATGRVIERLAAVDPAVVAGQLRKNFGQDNAIMAG